MAYLIDRLGPYHRARLDALGAVLDVCTVELRSSDQVYAWAPVEGVLGRRATLFYRAPDTDCNAIRTRTSAVLDDVAPDIVAIPGWATAFAVAALEWCLRRRVTAVLLSDSTAHDHRRYVWLEAVKRRLVGLFTSAHVGGTQHREYLQRLGFPEERVWDGYDVVDNNHFRDGAARARVNEQPLRSQHRLPSHYFLSVSRFVPKKNLAFLIAAYREYCSAAGEAAWALVLAGDGPERHDLEGRVREAGLNSHVIFSGFVQYDDLPTYFGLAGALIHPALTEPWGLVVNEALASRLPVLVSARCGCAPDLVEAGRNGFTFDPHQQASLVRQMLTVSRDEELRDRLGAASDRKAREFGLDRFVDGFTNAASVKPAERRQQKGDTLLLRLVAAASARRSTDA